MPVRKAENSLMKDVEREGEECRDVVIWFGCLVLNVGVVDECGRPQFATKMRVGLGGLLRRAGLGNRIEDGGSIGALSLEMVDQEEDGCRPGA
jgi:hypothetical protein